MIRYLILISCAFLLLSFPTELHAQKKRKKIKPIYYGKIQGGFLIDKYISKGNIGFTYFNLGSRKITGEKIQETGLASFYYRQRHDEERINNFYSRGFEQTGLGINFYHYIKYKKWDFGKLNLQVGPQFSFGYFKYKIALLNRFNFEEIINDFKVGVSTRLELNYKIDGRYTLALGTEYTLFQFGLRKIRQQQLEDYIHADLLPNRSLIYIGIITRFGKVRVNRAKLQRKREKERQKKQNKIAKKRVQKQKKKDKKSKNRKQQKKKS